MPRISGVVARFQQRQKEQKDQDDQPKLLIVPCSRHDMKRSHAPFLLTEKLRDRFEKDVLIQVVSQAQPQLRLFLRCQPKVFLKTLDGISIMDEITQSAKIVDKQVELRVADKVEARLAEVVVLVFERYLSKRDIWHLHAAMMQDGGQILYANFDYVLRQLVPNSQIDRLIAAGKSVHSGLVDSATEVSFKSATANMVVLVQISSELFEFGLSGRPYWEALIECFQTLVDKSLRVTRGSGHYIRMMMFTRVRGVKLGPNFKVDQDTYAKPKESPTDVEDFCDVFWEGFARVMPSAPVLAARIRRVCMRLHEEKHGRVDPGSQAWCDDEWSGLPAHGIVEAARGNILESLNLVLDVFDRHYLDRMLRSTGQAMVLLSAGNGLIESPSRDLYELTHRRFAITRPMTCQFVCTRGPPMHPVPWVQWPGGPGYDAPLMEEDLPRSPPWIQIAFYPEVRFCPCRAEDWVEASFMPLLGRSKDSTIIPHWTKAECSLSDLPATTAATQRTPSKKAHTIRWADRRLWEQVRTPALRSFFTRECGDDEGFKFPRYVLAPSRFEYTDLESEKVNVMQDLVGLRLEVTPGAQLYGFDEALNEPALPGSLPRDECESPKKECGDMVLHGELVPKSLHCLVVRTPMSSWKFSSQFGNLEVYHQEGDYEELHSTHLYRFYIRRHLVRQRQLLEDAKTPTAPSESSQWTKSRVSFHLPVEPDWNALDNVVAGGLRMPPALPYPVKIGSDGPLAQDPCIGWMLRSALKQNLFVLRPKETAWSHLEIFERACQHLNGSFE
ncbi:unnamed protein product, partial [Effrenium voratum]